MAKQSKAAQSLCLWVRAMDTYARVLRVVEPKRQALAGAQERLGAMSGALLAKQQQLAALEARVAKLQSHLHVGSGGVGLPVIKAGCGAAVAWGRERQVEGFATRQQDETKSPCSPLTARGGI